MRVFTGARSSIARFTRVLQLSLTQPQVDCITAYLRSSAAAQSHSATPVSRVPSSSASQLSPLAQRHSINTTDSPSSFSPSAVAVPPDDEVLVADLVCLLSLAGLAPPSSRRPVAAMLCAAGIGSAEALAQVLQQDPDFLSNKVPCASVARHLALTRVLQLSLKQPQAHCLADYVRRHQARQAAQRFNRSLLMAASAAAAVALISAALLRLSRRQ